MAKQVITAREIFEGIQQNRANIDMLTKTAAEYPEDSLVYSAIIDKIESLKAEEEVLYSKTFTPIRVRSKLPGEPAVKMDPEDLDESEGAAENSED